MGLRVGIVTGNAVPEVGGGWTFSTMLTGALKTAQGPHAFIALDGMNDKNINNWPEAVAPREHIDIVWFLKPDAEPLSIPYVATVWDLEHRKQPYFPVVSSTWSARENVYNALLPRASLIITGTQAGKEEVMHYYRVNPANVMVIPFPAPSDALKAQSLESEAIKEKYGLDGDFLIYPAQFWSHKNHVNLLRGLRLLRDQYGLDLDHVLTGSDHGNRDHVMREVVELGFSDRVFVLGFIPREDFIALYRVATALVFPTISDLTTFLRWRHLRWVARSSQLTFQGRENS
jgi:glycosyltransferase involved in cell wall biosynthesis